MDQAEIWAGLNKALVGSGQILAKLKEEWKDEGVKVMSILQNSGIISFNQDNNDPLTFRVTLTTNSAAFFFSSRMDQMLREIQVLE